MFCVLKKIWIFRTSFFLYINYAAVTDLTFSVKGKSTFSACSELFNSSYLECIYIFMFFKLFSLKLKILTWIKLAFLNKKSCFLRESRTS